ncbi:MAG: hypothetical protein M3R44_00195 [Candidatus Eremiobacteraeota bacterium]|nr:hypothetical protein [Candidatus Eremiobacteraeota bacterium]
MKFKSVLYAVAGVAVAVLGAKFLTGSIGSKRADAGAGSLSTAQTDELIGVVQAAYESTLAAFDPSGDEATDYEVRDARASSDADALQRTLDAVRSGLKSDLAQVSQAFADNIASAQLQIMAFAINRKNRGLPDSAQAEAETSDLKDFKRNAEPLYQRLVSALT